MATSFITDQTPAGDFEKITVSTLAVGVTASKLKINLGGGAYKRCVRAFVSVEAQPLRFRFDGTAPTSATGHAAADGAYFTIDGEANVANLKFIRSGGTDSTIQVTLFYNL